MFRNLSNFGVSLSFQVRTYARKPLWMPTAKSKVFRVPKRVVLPEEETQEILRLFNNYRTGIKSIRRFLTYRYSVVLQAKSDTEQLKKAFEEDLARCSKINDDWNEKIKAEREIRLKAKLEEELRFASERKANILRKEEEQLKLAEEIVRREKEAAESFITPETLDEVIEKAINNPTDYNFAIDLDGNRIMGRDTKPTLLTK